MTAEEKHLGEFGYDHLRKLDDGRWIGVMRLMFTWGLFVGIDETGYAYRYCYHDRDAAVDACDTWSGEGYPPGPWIKRKG